MDDKHVDLGLDVPSKSDAWNKITSAHVETPNFLDLTVDNEYPSFGSGTDDLHYDDPLDSMPSLDMWTKEDMEINLLHLKLLDVHIVDFSWADEQLNKFLDRMRLELKSCTSMRKLNLLIDEINSMDEALAEYTGKEYFSNGYKTLEKDINRARLVFSPKLPDPTPAPKPAPAKVAIANINLFPRWMIHPTTLKRLLCPDAHAAGIKKREGYVWLDKWEKQIAR